MKHSKMPDLEQAGNEAGWIARLAVLGATNRDAYRVLRELMWQFVVENSSRSDFPSETS